MCNTKPETICVTFVDSEINSHCNNFIIFFGYARHFIAALLKAKLLHVLVQRRELHKSILYIVEHLSSVA